MGMLGYELGNITSRQNTTSCREGPSGIWALGPVAWKPLRLRLFCVTHYVILNVILYGFYEWNGEEDDVMRDANWS